LTTSVLLVGVLSEQLGDEHGTGVGSAAAASAVWSVSWSLLATPIWVGWAVESGVWLHFRRFRTRALRAGLTPNHGHIKIRGHDEIFFYNLILTLIVRMLDGAYSCTWVLLFTVVWVQLGLVMVLYIACFAFCMFGLLFSHTRYFRAWNLAEYRGVFVKSLVLVSCGSLTVALYFAFWINLARRLDGDRSISFASILLPLVRCRSDSPHRYRSLARGGCVLAATPPPCPCVRVCGVRLWSVGAVA
jgi:hypothetical protein